ncbi:ABC transporter permease [Funiculus sociatus GB2-A5]|uniref:Transport permease protein n=1 Tax=Funiculus sociatus GB2-A5 TaxID=2933946 RepID=A0ABV0JQK2_9CYAN|nr:ABC transporter permease [Trichocoleus sp. FACHB-832]MBD2063112.1 ABC transporter permease [Trichocoleus sp. FACHB-6]
MQTGDKKIIIRPGNQSLVDSLREFWDYRDLLYILAAREVSVRYKQTVIGVVWVVLQPLMTTLIFTVVFGRFAKIPSDGIPYAIFSYSALVLWSLFSQGMERAANSIIADGNLITKVYFPRLVIPFAAVGSAWIDFAVSLFILLPLTYIYGLRPTGSLLLIPLVMIVVMISAGGVGTLLAGLNVRYRDFRYIIPFFLQIWLYASPIVYPVSIVPESLRLLYYLNPMAGLIEAFRFAVSGQGSFSGMGLGISAVTSVIIFPIGLTVFRQVERSFADFI